MLEHNRQQRGDNGLRCGSREAGAAEIMAQSGGPVAGGDAVLCSDLQTAGMGKTAATAVPCQRHADAARKDQHGYHEHQPGSKRHPEGNGH